MNTCKTCRYLSRRRADGCKVCVYGNGERPVNMLDIACEAYELHTREFFQRITNAERRIAAMAEQCEHFRELAVQATGSTQAIRVGGTRRRSKIEDGVVNLLDLIDSIDHCALQLKRWRDEATEVIEALDDPQAKEVLELRYFSALNWTQIALRMHYEIAQVHRIHRRALQLAAVEIERRSGGAA